MRVVVAVTILFLLSGAISFGLGWMARGRENEKVVSRRAMRRSDRMKARFDSRLSATRPHPSQVVQARYAPTSSDRSAVGNLED